VINDYCISCTILQYSRKINYQKQISRYLGIYQRSVYVKINKCTKHFYEQIITTVFFSGQFVEDGIFVQPVVYNFYKYCFMLVINLHLIHNNVTVFELKFQLKAI